MTATQSVAGGGGRFAATLEVEAGRRYGIAAAVGGTGGFFTGSATVELKIEGSPLEVSPILIRSFTQTAGLTLMPEVFFTAQESGTVSFEFVNASTSTVPGVFNIVTGDTTTVRFELVVSDEGSDGPPQGPLELTLGETATQSVARGGKFAATLEVEAGRRYGIAAAVGGTSGFFTGSETVELKIEGNPIEASPILIRNFFQTAGLTLVPENFFTAQESGTVTFEFVNASTSAVPGVFTGDTTVRFELVVSDEGTDGPPP